jgi:nitrate reductase molybdenum cofactor assembly chaperone NarJ/NarW
MKTLKVLSALLGYPTPELLAAAPELRAALQSEGVLKRRALDGVIRLIDELGRLDPFDAQERYILLFDRTRSLSLHLFEHVHGESRDRGQAMVDLIKVYEDAGYTPTASELPDYLPLFLEFAALRERLAKRRSPYEAVFAALSALSQSKLDEAALAALRAEPDPEPDDLEALDAAWAEEEVAFGPGSAADACGKDALSAKLRQARRPAPGLEPTPGAPSRTVFTHQTTAGPGA